MVMMYAVKATGTLRVSKEGELEGLDIHEHGGPAYPELSMGSSTRRHGGHQGLERRGAGCSGSDASAHASSAGEAFASLARTLTRGARPRAGWAVRLA